MASRNETQFENLCTEWLQSGVGSRLKRSFEDGSSPDLSLFARGRIAWMVSDLSQPKYALALGISPRTLESFIAGNASTLQPRYISKICGFATNSQKPFVREIEENDFQDMRFDGPQAPQNFARWLRGESLLGNGLELWEARQTKYHFDDNEDRLSLIRQIEDFFSGERAGKIQPVWAPDMPPGLTALADYMLTVKKKEIDDRFDAVVYLPVSYYVYARKESVELPQAVAWLDAFYSGRTMIGAALPETEVDLARAIARIRRRMMENRVLIVMDGAPDFKGVLPHLRALVADDAASFLLRQLIHPLFEAVPQDMTAFDHTKILLLSDGPYEALAAYCADALQLLPPRFDDQLESLKAKDYRNEEDLHKLLKAKRSSEKEIEAVFPILDTRISLQKLEYETYKGSALKKVADIPESQHARRLLEDVEAVEWGDDRPIFTVLAFIGFSIGGISGRSLMRVLRRWARLPITAEFASHLQVKRDLPVEDLEKVLDLIHSLICRIDHRRSQDVRYLTETTALHDSDLDVDTELLTSTLDFRSPRLRQWIVENLIGKLSADQIGLMQRLLAENAIHNHTLITRYSDRHDGQNARSYRRLTRALYHGFNSLACSPHIKDRTKELDFVLPDDPRQAFLRLYCVFYRKLLEAPPHWEMSRSMNAEEAKRDILFLAMNAADDECVANAITFAREIEPKAPEWLFSKHKSDNVVVIGVIKDILVNFARSSVSLNHLASFRETLDVWNQLFKRTRTQLGLDPRLSRSSGMIKAEIDALILQKELEKARDTITKHLDDLEKDAKAASPETASIGVHTTLGDMIKILRDYVSGGNVSDEDRSMRLERDLKTMINGFQAGIPDPALFSDLLTRYAEVIAIEAGTHSPDDQSPRLADLLRSFMWYFSAEQIRRGAFDLAPLSDSHIISGHQTREYIRTALSLAAEFDGQMAQYFLSKARSQADILTRYYTRYSSERPGMLILEALFAKHVNKLEHALELLVDAENRMVWTTDRPRLRMRLLLERAVILAACSRQPETPPEKASRFASAAISDSQRLSQLVQNVETPLWDWLADYLSKEVDDLLPEIPSRAAE